MSHRKQWNALRATALGIVLLMAISGNLHPESKAFTYGWVAFIVLVAVPHAFNDHLQPTTAMEKWLSIASISVAVAWTFLMWALS